VETGCGLGPGHSCESLIGCAKVWMPHSDNARDRDGVIYKDRVNVKPLPLISENTTLFAMYY